MKNVLISKKKMICGLSSLIALIFTIIVFVFEYIAFTNPHFYYDDNYYYNCYLGQFYGDYSKEFSNYNSTLTSSANEYHINITVDYTYSSTISTSIYYDLNGDYLSVRYVYSSGGTLWICYFDVSEYGIFPDAVAKNELNETQIELAEAGLKFSNALIDSNLNNIYTSYSVTNLLYEYYTFVEQLPAIKTFLGVFDFIFVLITLVTFFLFIIQSRKNIKNNSDGVNETLSIDSNEI